MLHMEYNLSI